MQFHQGWFSSLFYELSDPLSRDGLLTCFIIYPNPHEERATAPMKFIKSSFENIIVAIIFYLMISSNQEGIFKTFPINICCRNLIIFKNCSFWNPKFGKLLNLAYFNRNPIFPYILNKILLYVKNVIILLST